MADNFIVSARKYRPQTWESVVGQSSITDTLQNAIAQQQIAQAYLFCGPRGVGKTTCARIFSREINKEFLAEGEEMVFNIFELDAASNNSVDDIRQLTEQVRIPPQQGKYKVYIIDEVHMLSQSAFNAFLKTLEEPPAHAIFVLATTEKHKIIPTILSRCQIFDFSRITVTDMRKHLAYIAEQEGVTSDTESLQLIATKADGALRDALSIFDQLVAFCGKQFEYPQVSANLNVLDHETYFNLVDHALASDIPSALILLNEVFKRGFDGHQLVIGFGEHLRTLMISKDAKTNAMLELSEGVAERYASQAAQTDIRWLVSGMELSNTADLNYRSSKNQRLLVELMVMQICSLKEEAQKKKAGSV